MADWQTAIDTENFTLQLSTACPFQSLGGYLPAQSGGTETGFECHHDDAAELLGDYGDVDFSRPWKFALSFRWGGDLAACLAAYMAAAVYAKATEGIVFDPEEGQILTPQEALAHARQLETELAGGGA